MSALSWQEVVSLDLSPMARSHDDEEHGVYRYTDQYGRVVTLDTKRGTYTAERGQTANNERHRVGAKYAAASHGGHGCPHGALILRGVDDCWAIACVDCGKRWCNPALDLEAMAFHRSEPETAESTRKTRRAVAGKVKP